MVVIKADVMSLAPHPLITDSTHDQFIDGHEARRRSGVCKSLQYELIHARLYPAPVKVGRKSLWVEREVSAWIRTRIAERDAANGGAR